MASPASKKTLVERVQYAETGECFDANSFLQQYDEKALFEARRKEEEAFLNGKKYFVCSLCGGAVKLRGIKAKVNIHFCHRDTKESKNCPLHQGEKLPYEELRAREYAGVKESDLHKKLCRQLAEAIEKSQNCFEALVNKVYQRTEHTNRFRPDVQALCYGKNVVFEIQLSHDFLPVIVKREAFYKQQKTYLIWIFNTFKNNRFFEKDIFYGNKCHAFVFSEKQYKESIEKNDLIFECHYYRPYITKNRTIESKFQSKTISFKELIFADDFTCYYYDYDKRYKLLEKALEKANLAKLKNEAEKRKKKDREKFSALIKEIKELAELTPEKNRFSQEIIDKCTELVALVNQYTTKDDTLLQKWRLSDIILLLQTTYSAHKGYLVGATTHNNKWLFNHLHTSKKEFFLYFVYLASKKGSQIENYNLKKIQVAKKSLMEDANSKFFMPQRILKILQYFFREIYDSIMNNPYVKFIKK